MEVPLGVTVLEAEIRAGLSRMRLAAGREAVENAW